MNLLKSKRLQKGLLVAVFLIAFLLRIYNLHLDLPNLYSDEVDLHYKTQNWVIHSNIFTPSGLFNHIFYGLFTYTWNFGLNPLGVRLPSALYMSVVVILMFYFSSLISRELKVKSFWLPFIATLLTALLPWSFITSRIGFAHIALLTAILLWHFILFLKAQTFKSYIISLIPLLLAVFYYQTAIVVAPFILFLILLQIKTFSSRKQIFQYIGVCGIFLLLTVLIFLFRPNYSNVSVGERGLDLAIWRDVNVTSETNLYRGLAKDSQPTLFSLYSSPEVFGNKIFYNSSIAVLQKIFTNYLSYFSPEFLFLRGDPVLRHSTGQTGNFYLMLLPFMILGIFYLFLSKSTKVKQMFLFWILVTPIASSLTKDGLAGLNRVSAMMPFLTFLCAYGFYKSVFLFSRFKFIYIGAISILFIYSCVYYFYGYFHVYPSLAAKDFEYGFRQISDIQVKEKNTPMLVLWDGYYPHWHFRFWQNTPWNEFNYFVPTETKIGQSVFNKRYKNLYFSLPQNDQDMKKFIESKRVKLLVVPEKYTNKYTLDLKAGKELNRILYPDKSTAFRIYTIK